MDNELMRYATGATKPTRQDKAVAKAAQPIYDEVRLTALKTDGSMALAGHIMEQAIQLDQMRRDLSQGDPGIDALIIRFEKIALEHVANLQMGLFCKWDI